MRGILDGLQSGERSGAPEALRGNDDAMAYYGVLADMLGSHFPDSDSLSPVAQAIGEAINSRRIRDWSTNIDIVNDMTNAIEDILFDLQADLGKKILIEAMDNTIDKLILVAKRRDLS